MKNHQNVRSRNSYSQAKQSMLSSRSPSYPPEPRYTQSVPATPPTAAIDKIDSNAKELVPSAAKPKASNFLSLIHKLNQHKDGEDRHLAFKATQAGQALCNYPQMLQRVGKRLQIMQDKTKPANTKGKKQSIEELQPALSKMLDSQMRQSQELSKIQSVSSLVKVKNKKHFQSQVSHKKTNASKVLSSFITQAEPPDVEQREDIRRQIRHTKLRFNVNQPSKPWEKQKSRSAATATRSVVRIKQQPRFRDTSPLLMAKLFQKIQD